MNEAAKDIVRPIDRRRDLTAAGGDVATGSSAPWRHSVAENTHCSMSHSSIRTAINAFVRKSRRFHAAAAPYMTSANFSDF